MFDRIRFVRTFMLAIGPISSAFDFVTFYVLLLILHASEVLFHTGWFVESLVSQPLVLLVIRTRRNSLRDRPSRALAMSIGAVALLGIALPYLPVAGLLGFTPLPARFYVMLIVLTIAYLTVVERAKAFVIQRWLPSSPTGCRSSPDRLPDRQMRSLS